MPLRILVPLDGSPESEVVLSHLARVADAEDDILLLHAVPVVTPPAGTLPAEILAPPRQAERYLGDVARRFPRFSTRLRVEAGEAAERIIALSRELPFDLIAMTTHARRGLSRLLLGSVAERVTRDARQPVFLVRPDVWAPTRPVRRFLVPVDLSPADAPVMAVVKPLAAKTGAEVVLLYVEPITVVADPVTGFAPMPQAATLPDPAPALEERRREFAAAGVPAQTDLARGDAADHVLERVRSLQADVVFMSRAVRSRLERWLTGSVTETVLKRAECPVVVRRIPRP